jgi:hypothetical protein
MSSNLKHQLAEDKMKRFVTYLMSIESNQLEMILKDLPDEFEKLEHETVCELIKRVIKNIMTCKYKCCL